MKNEKLNNISDQIKDLQIKYVDYLDPEKQHFNVGDSAYICIGDYDDDIIEVEIVDIDDFSENGKKPGGLIYYWFHYKEIPKVDYFIYKIKSWIYWNLLNCIIPRKYIGFFLGPNIPEYLGPGHAELAGRGEVLFKTKEQARLDYHFCNIKADLENLDYFINQREK